MFLPQEMKSKMQEENMNVIDMSIILIVLISWAYAYAQSQETVCLKHDQFLYTSITPQKSYLKK